MSEESVRYIGEVVEQLGQHLENLQRLVHKRVLPGQRYAFTRELQQAHVLVCQTDELLKRSGMNVRLGFVQSGRDIQPVMVRPVNTDDGVGAQGSGVLVGDEGTADPAGHGAPESLLGR